MGIARSSEVLGIAGGMFRNCRAADHRPSWRNPRWPSADRARSHLVALTCPTTGHPCLGRHSPSGMIGRPKTCPRGSQGSLGALTRPSNGPSSRPSAVGRRDHSLAAPEHRPLRRLRYDRQVKNLGPWQQRLLQTPNCEFLVATRRISAPTASGRFCLKSRQAATPGEKPSSPFRGRTQTRARARNRILVRSVRVMLPFVGDSKRSPSRPEARQSAVQTTEASTMADVEATKP